MRSPLLINEMTRSLRNASLAISLAAHCCVAAVFCVSFGKPFSPPRYAEVSFLGRLIEHIDIDVSSKQSNSVARKIDQTLLIPHQSPIEYDFRYAIKPAVGMAVPYEKEPCRLLPDIKKPVPLRAESVVMLYPQLPYNFLLFFKDRQHVHIELMFKVDSFDKYNAITIMRKISSGNLDADLLSMRYIDRYLFMQQARLTSGGWQTVKIDLRPKINDDSN